ncbi:uncharacterized protein Dwil_GK13259 [Drosophila willistoni]|uniref:Uncharacterized protein n=1 Tax=Drosophila willistoni TaxID=7260 RepID=B4N3S7_DROWI|nr:THO complex subunit 6 [Drosophila willistoni]EDW79282.1 uncharacterized protein Dwil_GK13259 [Drosophila willistoni]
MKQRDLKRAYNNVLAQTFSTSRRHLFAGNLFGDIFVLSLKELYNEEPPGQLKLFPQGDKVDVNCLAFYKDFLIVGSVGLVYGLKWNEETEVLDSKRAWEVKIPIQVDAVEVPDVNSFWLCQNTNSLYAGCGDCTIYQITLEDGRILRDFSGHTDYIHCVVGNSSSGCIYTGSEDGTVRIWSHKQKEQVSQIEPHRKCDLTRTDCGKWIGAVDVNDEWLLCGGGPYPSIWHLRSLRSPQDFGFPARVHVCNFVDDSVLIAGEHDHIESYTINGILQANIPVEHTACYSAIWQTEPFKFMSVAGFSNKLHILKDFRFLDSKITLYGNVENEKEEIEDNKIYY